MEQKRKITIFILTIVVLIIFAYVLKQGKKPIPTEGITSTWETFEYKEKEFPFPPTWTYTETLGDKNEVVGVKVLNKENEEINVFVGGGKGCEELPKQKLCLGKDPVYTNSQDPEAMQLFEMYVRINENPQ